MVQLRHGAMRERQEHLQRMQTALTTTQAKLKSFENLPPDLQASKSLYEKKVMRLESCRAALEECLAGL